MQSAIAAHQKMFSIFVWRVCGALSMNITEHDTISAQRTCLLVVSLSGKYTLCVHTKWLISRYHDKIQSEIQVIQLLFGIKNSRHDFVQFVFINFFVLFCGFSHDSFFFYTHFLSSSRIELRVNGVENSSCEFMSMDFPTSTSTQYQHSSKSLLLSSLAHVQVRVEGENEIWNYFPIHQNQISSLGSWEGGKGWTKTQKVISKKESWANDTAPL